MKRHSPSRRRALKQLVSLTALGAVNALRIPELQALESPGRLSIPGFGGKVIRRQDPDYELWRQSMIWHMSKPKRYPDMIVQARNANDVAEAVRYASKSGLKISVRSGGHNATGCSLRDGGMAIDVSGMDAIEIDGSRRVATIQPGVRSLALVTASREKGLTFPVPHCPSVGLGGFTMGGGIGWNYAQCGGMSTHSIVGADVVTADGKRVRATGEENPDLYWAIRGAGPGFFGVVTRLDLKLYPLPRGIAASSYIFTLAQLKSVNETLDTIRNEHDLERLELITVLMHHPEMPFDAPPETSKICFFTAFAFEESEEAARHALEPFAISPLATESLVKMENQPFDFEGLYERYFSLRDPAGRCARYAVDNVMTNRRSEALEAVAKHFTTAPSRDCHVLASSNMATQVRSDSCFSWAIDSYVGCYAIWDHEQDDERNFGWLDGCVPLMDPLADGHYVNEVEGRRRPERYRKCFSAENWERLEQLRRLHDPQGVFHSYLGLS